MDENSLKPLVNSSSTQNAEQTDPSSVNQKQQKYGSIHFKFLRSRSNSRKRDIKVFSEPNQGQIKSTPSFVAGKVDELKVQPTQLTFSISNDSRKNERSKALTATINQRRFSSSLYDELMKSQVGDEVCSVGTRNFDVVCLLLWNA